jgi:hypothetical protein
VLVGEEGEVSEVPQGVVMLGRRRRGRRWGVGGWHRGGDHRRGKQSAVGGKGLRAGARSRGRGLCFSFGP